VFGKCVEYRVNDRKVEKKQWEISISSINQPKGYNPNGHNNNNYPNE